MFLVVSNVGVESEKHDWTIKERRQKKKHNNALLVGSVCMYLEKSLLVYIFFLLNLLNDDGARTAQGERFFSFLFHF